VNYWLPAVRPIGWSSGNFRAEFDRVLLAAMKTDVSDLVPSPSALVSNRCRRADATGKFRREGNNGAMPLRMFQLNVRAGAVIRDSYLPDDCLALSLTFS